MPKILRIINRFNLGGPTYNAAYLSKYLNSDFETLLIGGAKDKTEANSEYIVNNLGIKPIIIDDMKREINIAKDYKAFHKLDKIIKDYKPDIVHTHASKAGALGRYAAYKNKVPVIIHTFHGHVFDAYFSSVQSNFYKHLERKLANISTRIIAISEEQKKDLAHKYNICEEKKIELIKLGFDLERFNQNIEEKRTQFRDKYLIDDDEVAIAITGRLVPIKNHKMFLEAVAQVLNKTSKKIRIFIVGDGESRKEIEDKAKELELDFVDFTLEQRKATISFTSWLKDVDVVNAGVEIVALTSLNEGTPVSLIEAQASGKPIATTDVGGISNIVIPGKSALLSPSDDADAFANNLLKLVEDKALRDEMSGKAKDFVMEHFHYSRLVNDMSELYYRLLEEVKSKKA